MSHSSFTTDVGSVTILKLFMVSACRSLHISTSGAKSNFFSQECLSGSDQVSLWIKLHCAALSMGPSLWSEHLVKVPLVDRVPVPLSLAPVGGSCQANLGRSVTQRTQENMTPREESYFGTNAKRYPPSPSPSPCPSVLHSDTFWRQQIFTELMSPGS